MKKSSKFWQGFLVAGIAALAVPSFVQGQSAGGGASDSSSGMTSGSQSSTTRSGSSDSSSSTSSGMTGSSGMSGSAGSDGMSSSPSMSGAGKDMASTEGDQRLNSQIRQVLNSDTSLAGAGRNIHLDTKNGQATLHGSVSSEAEKNQIEQKVKQQSNVDNVKNELQVASSGSSSSTGSSSGSSSSMRSPSTSSSTGSSSR